MTGTDDMERRYDTGADLLQAERQRLTTAIREARHDLKHEEAVCKRQTERLMEKGRQLDPFFFDNEDYVLRQCRDTFTERWERAAALIAVMEAKNWKNTEYRERKREYDRMEAERDAHARKARTLAESIKRMENRARSLYGQMKSLKEEEA